MSICSLQLFRINQQWAKDYAELSKKVDQDGANPDSTTNSPAHPSSCSQCVQLTLEIDSKTTLLKDLGMNYNKMKLIQSGLETRLEESEQERKKIADEYKAVSLQVI